MPKIRCPGKWQGIFSVITIVKLSLNRTCGITAGGTANREIETIAFLRSIAAHCARRDWLAPRAAPGKNRVQLRVRRGHSPPARSASRPGGAAGRCRFTDPRASAGPPN
jgi:hypothetical protein